MFLADSIFFIFFKALQADSSFLWLADRKSF